MLPWQFGRLSSESSGDGARAEYVLVRFTHYDAVGNVTSVEEFVDLTYSKVTESEYDDLNRVIARRETDPEVDNVLFQTGALVQRKIFGEF